MTVVFKTRVRTMILNKAICLLCVGMAWSLVLGCGDDKPKRKYNVLEGTVKNIDLSTNKVSMFWYSEKQGTEVTIDGTVTSETEVLINGRVAKLEDLIIGERIKVEGYQVGKGENKRLVATRVTVERSEVIDTSKSSEQGEGS